MNVSKTQWNAVTKQNKESTKFKDLWSWKKEKKKKLL